MELIESLKEQLKDLKLEKRSKVLSGKNTKEIDIKIKEIEERIKVDTNK